MGALRVMLFIALAASACPPALAAMNIESRVGYVDGVRPDDPSCNWDAGMVTRAAKVPDGTVVSTSSLPAAGLNLSLQVLRLTLTQGSRSSDHEVVVRGNVSRDDKLLATSDFTGQASFKAGKSSCDALREIGTSIGAELAEWVSRTSFMACAADCSGIHPDEPIVLANEILLGNPDALNSTVRDECHWPGAMVTRLVKAFNEYDPAPRAKLEARPIDLETYHGRRLVLRVMDVHAIGGGGFSGPKWMDLAGELREGDSLVASFTSHTKSGRGLTTCRSVESLSDSTASMIVEWLRSPSLAATLR